MVHNKNTEALAHSIQQAAQEVVKEGIEQLPREMSPSVLPDQLSDLLCVALAERVCGTVVKDGINIPEEAANGMAIKPQTVVRAIQSLAECVTELAENVLYQVVTEGRVEVPVATLVSDEANRMYGSFA